MELNLYNILKKILNEAVNAQDVINAINDKRQVIINYSDEENNAPNKRIIEPYVYGLSRAGNQVLRAYQYEGDTLRGIPKWKLFRLDRIESWTPTDNFFNEQPNAHGWNAEEYNKNGDKSMSQVIKQVQFDDEGDPTDTLSRLRKKTERLKKSTPINIKDMNDGNVKGAINPEEVVGNDVDDKFIQMVQRNLSLRNKENPIDKIDYDRDYELARREMNQQNQREKDIIRKREKRWQDSADSRTFARKGALNNSLMNDIEN